MKSATLTTIQFLCLGYILFTNEWLADSPVLIVIQFAGLALGTWSVVEMSRSKLNITPVPRKGATLISSGPYRLIRHPMYAALILAFFPLLVQDPSISNGIAFGVLLVNLILKLLYEEQLLLQRFPGYKEMTGRTWRLIPWVF